MGIINNMFKFRAVMTVLLALAGIGAMAYYDYCDTACSYLQGDIWGIDLKWVGVAYMSSVIVLNWSSLVRAMLAAGIGVEIFLIGFQIQAEVFCPFCLAFAVIVFAAFVINYKQSEHMTGSLLNKLIYALGDFSWPPVLKAKIPLILFTVIGYLFVFFTFNGTATPAYGSTLKTVPAIGSGRYELYIFSDYFCPPCQALEPKLEPLLEDLLATKHVKIIFIDVPIHRPTVLFDKFYLYAAKANGGASAVMRARRVLFQYAKSSPAAEGATDSSLAALFSKENVDFRRFDVKPVQSELTKIIRKFKVTSTPTGFIRYPDGKETEFEGGPAGILKGVESLKTSLVSPHRKTAIDQ